MLDFVLGFFVFASAHLVSDQMSGLKKIFDKSLNDSFNNSLANPTTFGCTKYAWKTSTPRILEMIVLHSSMSG